MIADDPITVKEGGGESYFTVKLSVPPSFLFDEVNATLDGIVNVRAQFQNSTDDLSCPDGGLIHQAVLGSFFEENPTCGVSISMTDWHDTYLIPVVAKIDGLYDGDQTRYLDIYAVLKINSQPSDPQLMKTLQVYA